MVSKPTSPQVMEYITKRPGQMIYIKDICEATRLNERQVMAAVNKLRRYDKLGEDLEVLQRARIWIYKPNSHPKKTDMGETCFLVERVGIWKDGVPLVRDEKGKMFALVPVTLDI